MGKAATPRALTVNSPGVTAFRGAVGATNALAALTTDAPGRTDLNGGSHPQMQDSLRDRVLPLDDDIVVLPGHGGQTSIGRERAANPFLAELIQ